MPWCQTCSLDDGSCKNFVLLCPRFLAPRGRRSPHLSLSESRIARPLQRMSCKSVWMPHENVRWALRFPRSGNVPVQDILLCLVPLRVITLGDATSMSRRSHHIQAVTLPKLMAYQRAQYRHPFHHPEGSVANLYDFDFAGSKWWLNSHES